MAKNTKFGDYTPPSYSRMTMEGEPTKKRRVKNILNNPVRLGDASDEAAKIKKLAVIRDSAGELEGAKMATPDITKEANAAYSESIRPLTVKYSEDSNKGKDKPKDTDKSKGEGKGKGKGEGEGEGKGKGKGEDKSDAKKPNKPKDTDADRIAKQVSRSEDSEAKGNDGPYGSKAKKKDPIVSKAELDKSGFTNLRDFMNAKKYDEATGKFVNRAKAKTRMDGKPANAVPPEYYLEDYKKGGSVKSKSASSRGDGCAQRGKTRGKMY